MENGAGSYRRFLDGDQEGFAAVVQEYREGLLFFLNGYVRNIHVAQQLTEDTFFKLLVKKPRYDSRYAFKTWLYTIGRRLATDWLRYQKRHPQIPFEECGWLCEQSPEEYFIAEEEKRTIHQAVARLNPDYRAALQLVYFQGFSNPQAAKVLHRSKRQMETLLYRARQSLRTELEKEGFSDETIE